MPKKDTNYNQTHFYKIVCKDLNVKECYVGHTTNFKNRKSEHKRRCETANARGHNLYVYCFIRANGGWKNWDMILLQTVSCKDGLHARQQEREFIEREYSMLNQDRPYITETERKETKRQWMLDNTDSVKASQARYYEENKELVKARAKKHYEENRETKLEYQHRYAETNKDRIQERVRKYRINNRETIIQRAYQRLTCECGGVFMRQGKSRHERTKKHQEYLSNQASEEHTEEFLQTTQDS